MSRRRRFARPDADGASSRFSRHFQPRCGRPAPLRLLSRRSRTGCASWHSPADLDYHEKVRLFLDRVLPPSKTCLYGNLSIRIPTRWEHLFDLLPYYKPPTLSEASNFLPPALDAAVRKVLRISEDDGFYMELGGIPSGAHAAAGSWHRDSFPIFDEKTDANLPPWYLTMVIPLIEDEENGAADGADGGAAFGGSWLCVFR